MLLRIPKPGDRALHPDINKPVVIDVIRHWPFPYAECVTDKEIRVAIPVSELFVLNARWS